MTRSLFFAAYMAALIGTGCFAAQQPQLEPIGYVIEVPQDDETEADGPIKTPEPKAFCVRDGQRLPASDGMELFNGDVVMTEADGTIAVAFLDSSAVTLRPSTRLTIKDYGYPSQKVPTHVSVEGRAFFDVPPRPADARFIVNLPLTHTAGLGPKTKPAKFEVWSVADGSGFKTVIGVLKGTVTVNPNGTDSVDVLNATQLILNIQNTNIAGWSPQNTTMTKGNISKADMKALDAGALCDVEVSVGPRKNVKIKSWNKNPDGTKTFIKLTEIDGKQIRINTIVKDEAGKVIARISATKGRETAKVTEGTWLVKQRISGNEGTATIRDAATKKTYKGKVTKMADGTVITDCKAKDGSRLVLTKQTLPDGTVVTTKTTFAAGATQGTQYTEIKRRDGFRDTWVETVTTTQLQNGDFESVSGPVNAAQAPALPPGAPKVLSPSAIVIPDTTTPLRKGWKLVWVTPTTAIIVPDDNGPPISP